jgi:HTH-type transcriptional regulator/antitoxin HigA
MGVFQKMEHDGLDDVALPWVTTDVVDPDEYATPGEMLRDLLEKKVWTQRVLAHVLGEDLSTVNRLIADKKPVDARLALALQEVFGLDAAKVLHLQQRHDLREAATRQRPNPVRRQRAELFQWPVTELVRRGWIDAVDVRDDASVERALASFNTGPLRFAAKKADAEAPATFLQRSWLLRVQHVAAGLHLMPFQADAAFELERYLAPLRATLDGIRRVTGLLASVGIRMVIVESLPGAKIDGACIWLADGSPVIGMSLRHDRVDNYWFVLRHELEHVLNGDGREGDDHYVLDVELEGVNASADAVSAEEATANRAAAEFCVPQAALDAFLAPRGPYVSERDMVAFSAKLGVHPGLVAGQLQRRTGRYDRFRAHLAKIRQVVTASTPTDGWSDVAKRNGEVFDE